MSHRIAFDSMEWQSSARGQRFRLFASSGKQVRILELTPEFEETHWCMKGHAGYVLEGVLELEFEDETEIMHADDGFFIPAGESDKHKARALTPRVSLLLVEDV